MLLEKDPGATTLYLPGEQITLDTVHQTTAGVRYYTLPGGGLAYRTGSGNAYGFEITDLHGTPVLTLDSTAQVPAWRQFTPFGAPRGASVTWPDNRGFLDKPADQNTGLTVVGAREYDPGAGRFVSLDPILEVTSPQELNGYTYAADNPVSQSDPNGLMLCADNICGSVQYLEHHTSSGGGGGSSSGICYYCRYAPSQYYGGGGGGGNTGCGYTIACAAPWAVPPRPRVYMVPAGGALCAHDGLCLPHQETAYHNPSTDWAMLGEFLTGFGGRNQYFNQWDPLTQSLMHDSNTATTISIIQQQLRNPMELAVFAHGHPLTGGHNYVDKPSPVNFIMDGLGALTGGRLGHNFADSFTGSYTQQYTVIAKSPNTATAYFTVQNQTNLNSLLHPQQTWPFVPIISAYFSIKSVSLPWDAGPFSEIDQTVQWQETIHY
jgi:RHS repeat-associated protein